MLGYVNLLGISFLHAFLTNKVRLRSVLVLALKPNSILRSMELGKNVDLLKCEVQWSRVSCIHQRRVRVLSLRACGDGARRYASNIDMDITQERIDFAGVHAVAYAGL